MNSFSQFSCHDFSQALASKTSVPGGGGAAAMVGALSAALCSMAGNFTAGKKKYAAYEADIQRILLEAEGLRQSLLVLVDADAIGFEPLAKAYAIPKEDPSRDAVMEQATLGACHAPMQMLFACADVMLMLEELLEKGSRLLLADVGCGAYLCKAAMESAALSVFVNTAILKNRESAAKIELQVDQILKTYLPMADKIATSVTAYIRKEG